ncbi:MAG TPA: fluoride efflux transporter CrcB [Bacillota bacterium]|nr:fluoride efflux transporter CrcB [Bacillota bacterium]
MKLKTLIWLGTGGALGALARHYTGNYLSSLIETDFPIATLMINWAGCLFLGYFLTVVPLHYKLSPNLGLAVGTGFTGAFTTFSTFSLENIRLLQHGQPLEMAAYILLSVCGGLLLAWGGIRAGYYSGLRQPGRSEG